MTHPNLYRIMSLYLRAVFVCVQTERSCLTDSVTCKTEPAVNIMKLYASVVSTKTFLFVQFKTFVQQNKAR